MVATVSSLQGEEIEPYANQLFRTWQLGEKAKNNGVLLLVAPNDRRVRIEVGYGLEGTLTDALSKVIITNAITPRFKNSDFSGGIERGVEDIITVLTTDSSEWQARPDLRLDSDPNKNSADWIVTMLFIAFVTMFIVWPGFRWFVLNVAAQYPDQLRRLPGSSSSSSSAAAAGAAAVRAAAAFPAEAAPPAAAARQGVGDDICPTTTASVSRPRSAPPKRAPRARSSACWPRHPPPARRCRC